MSISARWEQCIEKNRTLWFYILCIFRLKSLGKTFKKNYVKLMFRHVGCPSGNDGSTQIALILQHRKVKINSRNISPTDLQTHFSSSLNNRAVGRFLFSTTTTMGKWRSSSNHLHLHLLHLDPTPRFTTAKHHREVEDKFTETSFMAASWDPWHVERILLRNKKIQGTLQ